MDPQVPSEVVSIHRPGVSAVAPVAMVDSYQGIDEGQINGGVAVVRQHYIPAQQLEFPPGLQSGFARFWEKFLICMSHVLLVLTFLCQFRVVAEYERGIIFRLGKYCGEKRPGLFFLLPCVDSMVKVDMRVKSLDVVPQTVITRDSVTIRIDAVVYYKVDRPKHAIINVNNYQMATLYLSQTALRSVVGQSTLDEVLSKRAAIARKMKIILDEETVIWGIDICSVELKDVILPETMQRAMAAQAEAERERRAKVVLADGEYQAATKLTEAARLMGRQPGAIQLRYLQTLVEVSQDRNHTNIIPLPIKLLRNLFGGSEAAGGDGGASVVRRIVGQAMGGSQPPPPLPVIGEDHQQPMFPTVVMGGGAGARGED